MQKAKKKKEESSGCFVVVVVVTYAPFEAGLKCDKSPLAAHRTILCYESRDVNKEGIHGKSRSVQECGRVMGIGLEIGGMLLLSLSECLLVWQIVLC